VEIRPLSKFDGASRLLSMRKSEGSCTELSDENLAKRHEKSTAFSEVRRLLVGVAWGLQRPCKEEVASGNEHVCGEGAAKSELLCVGAVNASRPGNLSTELVDVGWANGVENSA